MSTAIMTRDAKARSTRRHGPIPNWVRFWCAVRGKSYRQLSIEINMSRSHLQRVITQDTDASDGDKLLIAVKLGVGVHEVFFRENAWPNQYELRQLIHDHPEIHFDVAALEVIHALTY